MAQRTPKNPEARAQIEQNKYIVRECIDEVQLKMAIAKNIHVSCIYDSTYGCKYPLHMIGKRMSQFACYNPRPLQGFDFLKRTRPSTLTHNRSRQKIDHSIRAKLQHAIKELMLAKRELPTFKNLLPALQDLTDTPSLPYLYKLGYFRQRLPGTNVSFIIEDPTCVRERYHYLKQMQQYREEGRYLVYVNEISPQEKNKHKCLFIAVSPTNGIINKTMLSFINDNAVKEKWLGNILIPMLPENSVLIMEEDKEPPAVPSAMSLKEEMIAWLEKHDVPHKATMHRAELHNLIINITPQKVPNLEWLGDLQNQPVKFLYRPVHMPEFDIKHLLKDDLKQSIEFQLTNAASGSDQRDLTKSDLDDIDWQDFDNKMAKREKLFLEQDAIIEDLIDQILNMSTDGEFTAEDLAESGMTVDSDISDDDKNEACLTQNT